MLDVFHSNQPLIRFGIYLIGDRAIRKVRLFIAQMVKTISHLSIHTYAKVIVEDSFISVPGWRKLSLYLQTLPQQKKLTYQPYSIVIFFCTNKNQTWSMIHSCVVFRE